MEQRQILCDLCGKEIDSRNPHQFFDAPTTLFSPEPVADAPQFEIRTTVVVERAMGEELTGDDAWTRIDACLRELTGDDAWTRIDTCLNCTIRLIKYADRKE